MSNQSIEQAILKLFDDDAQLQCYEILAKCQTEANPGAVLISLTTLAKSGRLEVRIDNGTVYISRKGTP